MYRDAALAMIGSLKRHLFPTAKGKAFYKQLMCQQYIALAGTKDKIAVPLRRKVKNVRKKNLDIMFEKNPYRLQCRKGLYRL